MGPQKKKKVSAKNLGNYILVKNMIGKGAYAEVFEGFRRDENKTPVAIKVIPRSKLNDKLMNSLEQEINIMKGIRHANIIRLYDVHVSCCCSRVLFFVLLVRINEWKIEKQASLLFGYGEMHRW
jgi:hypothetical protein